MSIIKWPEQFAPLTEKSLIEAAIDTAEWINQYGKKETAGKSWDVLPDTTIEKGSLLLDDTSIYSGTAGIAFFFLRLFQATNDEKWLKEAIDGIDYVISKYDKEAIANPIGFMKGAEVGFLNGPAGGAYVADILYDITKDEKYKTYIYQVAKDIADAAHEEGSGITWYGFYGMLGEGGLVLFYIHLYEKYRDEQFLEVAHKAANYVADQAEKAPTVGYRWNVMPTETFPTIGKPGGYFLGFEYGVAGCSYLLATVYQYSKDERFLELAKGGAEYVMDLADYTEDNEAALVRYNDTYLTDLYYLGVCQGPVGTSRLFYRLHELTGEEKYKEFVVKLTNGIVAAGAPQKHSKGYWRTNSYCCGAPGMLEHFVNVHKLTGNEKYLKLAHEAAETVLGEADRFSEHRHWYTAWNRHEPFKSEPYLGLYVGTAGCAASLLYLALYENNKNEKIYGYLEDPYKKLWR